MSAQSKRQKRVRKKALKQVDELLGNDISARQKALSELIKTAGGRQKLAASMADVLRTKMVEHSFARKIFQVQPFSISGKVNKNGK